MSKRKLSAVERAVVRRLWELCDGAEPVCRGMGICHDILYRCGNHAYFLVTDLVQSVNFETQSAYAFGRIEFWRLDLWDSESGPARRTLAGFLACAIQDGGL